MELTADAYATSEEWTKEDLKLLLTLAVQGKGRREISDIMNRPTSEIVQAALRYSIVLAA
jgi:hypothetical protein